MDGNRGGWAGEDILQRRSKGIALGNGFSRMQCARGVSRWEDGHELLTRERAEEISLPYSVHGLGDKTLSHRH